MREITFWELLSHDNRFLVLTDLEERTIYTWDRHRTLQVWRQTDPNYDWAEIDKWEEVAIRQLTIIPKTFEEARAEALAWKNA
jgi:hypothetical protein